MEPLTDSALIGASITEPEQFAEIFRRHRDAVAGYLYRRGGVGARDDLLGEVFTVAFAGRARFDQRYDSARPWLLGIATNLMHRRWRGETRRRSMLRRVPVEAEGVDDAEAVLAHLSAQGARPELVSMLRALTSAQRDLLVMWAWEQLSYAEIAQALDIPIGTVRSRIHRLRTTCVELLPVERAILD